MTNHK